MNTLIPPRLKPAQTAFFLDFDGTLVPFDKPDINTPVVDDALRSLLEELRGRADGALALITGRTIEVLDSLFDPLALAAAGEHGGEWRQTPGFEVESITPPPGLAAAQQHCEAFAQAHPGTRFERKKLSMVIHFHEFPGLRDAAAEAAKLACVPGSGIRMLHARGMVEVKPVDASKGQAIERFMQSAPFAGRVPVFIGDDVTDEDGFIAVNAQGGISIKVGSGSSHARYRLADEDAVRGWLESL
ncbi:trehalose-phosphatase [Niveibacterium terrae]|uniref:trehalose-phosphatase n=1 Tax=Niveibacterium terrae TaxID=3373598 RepID=UPI003A90CB6B